MAKAILVGMLNVVIPGAGMAVLRQWKTALAYFLALPVFLFLSLITLGMMAGQILTIQDHEIGIAPSFGSFWMFLLLLVAVVAIAWDAFMTPYKFAKGESQRYSIALVTILSAIVPGLGFIYLKRWGYAFGYAIWSPLALAIGAPLFSFLIGIPVYLLPDVAMKESVTVWLATILIKLFVIWDNAYFTQKAARETLAAKTAMQ